MDISEKGERPGEAGEDFSEWLNKLQGLMDDGDIDHVDALLHWKKGFTPEEYYKGS